MSLQLKNLEDDKIRELMLEEFEKDIIQGKIYLSTRLKEECKKIYLDLMRTAIQKGNDDSLAKEIYSKNCLISTESRNTPSGGFTQAQVPTDAHIILAESEFNRLYLRAICRKALEIGAAIEAYRAKSVSNPRPKSEAIIGKRFDPNELLEDLRKNIGKDTALGLPGGPYSGLSGKIVVPASDTSSSVVQV